MLSFGANSSCFHSGRALLTIKAISPILGFYFIARTISLPDAPVDPIKATFNGS